MDIKPIPRGSTEEINDLVSRWQDRRDQRAFEKLLAMHVKSIRKLAHEMANDADTQESLIAVGEAEFWQACDDSDRDHEAPFSGYAYRRVAREMRKQVHRWGRAFTIPRSTLRQFAEIGRIERQGREEKQLVTDETTAKALGITAEEVEVIRYTVLAQDEGIDAGVDDDDGFIPAGLIEPGPSPEELSAGQVRDALRVLTARQREAIYLRIWKDLTAQEVADAMGGISRKRVNELIADGLEKLRVELGVAPTDDVVTVVTEALENA